MAKQGPVCPVFNWVRPGDGQFMFPEGMDLRDIIEYNKIYKDAFYPPIEGYFVCSLYTTGKGEYVFTSLGE